MKNRFTIGQMAKLHDESYSKLLKYIDYKGMSVQEEAVEILVMCSSLTIKPDEWRTQIQIAVK